jgi:hypothetical protein
VPAEEVWAAVRGELTPERRRAIVGHTAVCASCAEAWRLAMEVTPDAIAAAAPRPPAAGAPRWPATFVPLAAAAALVLAVGAGVWLSRPPRSTTAPGFRGGEAGGIRSLIADGEALPRDRFRLRWSAGPAGSRYAVRVTTESLDVVAEAEGLEEPAFLVPPPALSSLPAGAALLWRVEAVRPEGERTASPTFLARLGP